MIANIEESINVNGVFIDQKPAYNKMLNGEVALQLNKNVVAGQVKQRALIPEGKIVGKYYYNPMVNSMIYEQSSTYPSQYHTCQFHLDSSCCHHR